MDGSVHKGIYVKPIHVYSIFEYVGINATSIIKTYAINVLYLNV